MQSLVRVGISVLFLLALATVGPGTDEQEGFGYRLKVRIDPASHALEGEAWIQAPPSGQFFLHPDLVVGGVTADGGAIAFRRDPSQHLEYTEATAVVLETHGARELHVEWGGTIGGVVAAVNMISPELVELAYYATWFPAFEGMKDFAFEMDVDLPEAFVTTTNGRRTSAEAAQGRSKTTWVSWAPTWDLVIVASPGFERLVGGFGKDGFEAYYEDLPAQWVRTRMEGMVGCRGWLVDLLGPSPAEAPVRFAFAPRDGWAYYREPLSVMGQGRTRSTMGDPLREAGDFQGGCHEIAHFWWGIADAATPEDWINEGLAEFSAFRFTAGRFGSEYAERRLEEYRQGASHSQTSAAIVETEASSPDREVNRYQKTTLMFLEAQHRFGEESLDRFLRAFYRRFAGTRDATTSLFLEDVETHLGVEARDYFHEELHRRPEVGAVDDSPGS